MSARWPQMILGFVLLLVALVTSRSLGHEFTNYDDNAHLTYNAHVQSLNASTIRHIFSSEVNQTYIPLTILSFAVEHYFFKLNPFVFHFNNWVLHLAVVFCVFNLALKLGLTPSAAGLAALIFGVHPMHVESFAWVTQRKDVLYALFYLLAMMSYWEYLRQQKRRFYLFSVFLGLMSLLAKPMAVSLPLSLSVLDWFFRRNMDRWVILDKIPHLLYVLPVGWLTYQYHARIIIESWISAGLLWICTFVFYIQKFFWPAVLSPVYPVPAPIGFMNLSYLGAVCLFVILGLLIWFWRRNRWVVLAAIFYAVNIFFLLRYDTRMDFNVVADRFMYIPSLGVCFCLGWGMDRWIHASRPLIKLGMVVIIFSLLAGKTWQQVAIWKNSETLWTASLKSFPANPIAYHYRAQAFHSQGRLEDALNDLNRAIELNPHFAEAYINRADHWMRQGKDDLAFLDYTQALKYRRYYDAYNNRGIIYKNKGQYNLALQDYEAALKINPKSHEAHNNKGVVYKLQKNYDLALSEYQRAIELNPKYAESYTNRANVYKEMGRFEQALYDYNQALMINPDFAPAYLNRSDLYLKQGDIKKAWDDLLKAKQFGLEKEIYTRQVQSLMGETVYP